jgi:hypothetical protein
MAQVRAETLAEIEAAFKRYEDVVLSAGVEKTTEDTYLRNGRYFIRWLRDDFKPGATLKH